MKLRTLACTLALAAAATLSTNALAQHAEPPAKTVEGVKAEAEHATEHAGGHEAPKAGVLPTVEQGIAPMVVSLVVFGLVLAVLSAKVWPVITKGLKEREDKIRTAIEEAELARQQAKDALEEYQTSLASARAEAQKMLEQTRQQQQALATELKAKAEKDATEMRDRARVDIENAKRAAVAELYNHAASLGTTIAGKILQRTVTPADTANLVEESLRQLEASQR